MCYLYSICILISCVTVSLRDEDYWQVPIAACVFHESGLDEAELHSYFTVVVAVG